MTAICFPILVADMLDFSVELDHLNFYACVQEPMVEIRHEGYFSLLEEIHKQEEKERRLATSGSWENLGVFPITLLDPIEWRRKGESCKFQALFLQLRTKTLHHREN
ncbi:hypothetical protein VNO77_34428 [Canavalia gladiata]|uniref:Uncharacterized protein n=1 Tax=Canavalia gladiata TaxID=3824 RepID=A0AAN9KGP6_CANGL